MRKSATMPGLVGAPGGAPGPVSIAPAPIATPAPLKPRRRVGMILAGVVLVVVSALFTTWLVTSQSTTSQVLAVTRSVPRGATISAGDLTSVAVPGAGVLRTVPADQADHVVGKIATVDLLAGSLVTTGSYADALAVGEGKALIGVTIDVAHRPATSLHAGDKVVFVESPVASGDAKGNARQILADVASVTVVGEAVTVDAEVDVAQAGLLAQLAAAGRATVVLVDPETKTTSVPGDGPAEAPGTGG